MTIRQDVVAHPASAGDAQVKQVRMKYRNSSYLGVSNLEGNPLHPCIRSECPGDKKLFC